MSDLSTLMQYAPTTGAGFAGLNQKNKELEDQLRQQELAQLISARTQDAQFKAQQQPFELEKLRLGNQKTTAEIPGIQANSDLARTNATKAAGTLQSDIDAGNTENAMKIYETVGSKLGTLSSALDGASTDVERVQKFGEALSGMNLPAKTHQAFLQRYANVPPAELQKRLLADQAQILRANKGYTQAMDVQGLANEGHIKTTGMNNATQVQLEKMRIEAGKYDRAKKEQDAAKMWEAQVAKAAGGKAKHAAALAAAAWFSQNGLPDKAAQFSLMAEQLRPQAEAEIANTAPRPGSVDVQGLTQGGVPTAPPRSIAPGGQSAPQPKPNGQKFSGQRVSVIGPDGRRGSVPVEQLQQALSQGYKKVQ